MVETATTGDLEQAQNTIIREARYTQEANAPSWQLIEKVRLPKGASTVRVPKVGQFTRRDYRDFYDDSTRSRVATHWARDLDLFGYDFDGLVERRVVRFIGGSARMMSHR